MKTNKNIQFAKKAKRYIYKFNSSGFSHNGKSWKEKLLNIWFSNNTDMIINKEFKGERKFKKSLESFKSSRSNDSLVSNRPEVIKPKIFQDKRKKVSNKKVKIGHDFSHFMKTFDEDEN